MRGHRPRSRFEEQSAKTRKRSTATQSVCVCVFPRSEVKCFEWLVLVAKPQSLRLQDSALSEPRQGFCCAEWIAWNKSAPGAPDCVSFLLANNIRTEGGHHAKQRQCGTNTPQWHVCSTKNEFRAVPRSTFQMCENPRPPKRTGYMTMAGGGESA